MTYQSWFLRLGAVGLFLMAGAYALRSASVQPPARAGLIVGIDESVGTGEVVSTPPGSAVPFTITAPVDGAVSLTPFVTLLGVGPRGAVIAVDANVATVTSQNTWALSVRLVEGVNTLRVVATNIDGATSEVTLNVVYDPSALTTTTRPLTTTTRRPTTTIDRPTTSQDTTPTSEDTTSSSDDTTTTSTEDTTTTTEDTTTTTEEPTTTTPPTDPPPDG